MAWTAPMTFTANTVLTAAQLNTHLRDNLMETAPAKATTAGSFFVGTGLNSISERIPGAQRVSTSESTASTSFTNLSTVGPSVTVTTGSRALVLVSSYLFNTNINSATFVSYDISGATTRAALTGTSITLDGQPASQAMRMGTSNYETILTPGVNTFTMKYAVGSGTGTFADRNLVVIPY